MSALPIEKRDLTCRLITDFAELRALASAWETLWQANPGRQIFSKFSWIDAWWQGYGAQARLLTPAVFEDGACIGIVPLLIDDRVVRFVGDPATDYNDLICDPHRKSEVFASAIRALDEAPVPWDSCNFENVSESSLIVGAHSDVSSNLHKRIGKSVSALCPTVMLGDDRAETLKGILGKATVTRRIRQLQKLGTLTFRLLEDREQASRHLLSFYQQHIRCRALAGIRSQFIDPESRDFFAALIKNLDPATDVRFSVLELDNRPIAYNFGFQLDGKYLYYTPTYDVDYFDLSPGEVLLRYLFLYAQASDVREFDFTVGDETYKDRYANLTRRNFALILFPRTAKGLIGHAAHAAQETLRSRPTVYRTAKNVLSAARATGGRIARAVRRDGLAKIAGNLAVRLFRSAIYARDEVLVFTLRRPDLVPPLRGLIFREGRLSDLADAVVAFPEYLGDGTLHDLRERLKKGHTPFVVLDDGVVIHIVWSKVEDRLKTAELGEDFEFVFGRPTGIMYDARTPAAARGKGAYPIALSRVAEHISESGLEPIGYVQTDNAPSKRGCEKLGMELRGRMIRSVWFHWINRCVAQEVSQNG